MAYNFTKKTCDKCGCGEHPRKNERINNEYPFSFRLGFDGSVLCAKCHREKSLEELFTLADKKFGPPTTW